MGLTCQIFSASFRGRSSSTKCSEVKILLKL